MRRPSGVPGGFAERSDTRRQPGAKITNTEYRPHSTSKNRTTTRILVALFSIFGVAVVAFSLHIFKLVDFGALLLGEEPVVSMDKPEVEPKIEDTAAPVQPPKPAKPSAAIEKQVEIFIEDAKRSMDSNKFADARGKLETALELTPQQFEIYELLIEVYESTNERELAEQMKAKLKEMRGIAGGEDRDAEGDVDAPRKEDAVAAPTP
ncbi:MAG: hypothetical protein AAGI01_02635 [Myxococcota bacterium]